MKTRLNEISLAQFIELMCGNYSVLLNNDTVSDSELEDCARTLITSYRFISDKSGMKALLIEKENTIKCKMKVFFLRICNLLVMQEEFEEVRSLLALIDENTSEVDNDDLPEKVSELLRYAIFEQDRSEDNETIRNAKPSSEDIRSYYDAEIAFIMTYVKMSIDMYSINAAVYANIVNQVNVDIVNKRRTFK